MTTMLKINQSAVELFRADEIPPSGIDQSHDTFLERAHNPISQDQPREAKSARPGDIQSDDTSDHSVGENSPTHTDVRRIHEKIETSQTVSGRTDLWYSKGEWQLYTESRSCHMKSEAKTTFRSFDADTRQQKKFFDRLWRYQMGRGHRYVDDNKKKTFVRRDATRKRCDAILQSCDVPRWARSISLAQVSRRNLNNFSRYYAGADGACIGFALLALCNNPDEAKRLWVADKAPEVVPGFDDDTVSSLIDYVFRKYGRDN